MLKFFDGEEKQRILILNYNTILLQSVGFLNYMKKFHGVDNPFSKYEDKEMEYIINVLRFAHKNTAKIIDKTIEEDFYFKFIKSAFREITNESPLAYAHYYIDILLSQKFVQEIHIASPVAMNVNEVYTNVIEAVFDIFDENQIVNYINEKGITCLFIHDIDLLKKIIDHPKMDSQQFTYLLSKIGYNYREEDDAIFLKIPEIVDLRDTKQYLLGIVNLPSDDDTENIIF